MCCENYEADQMPGHWKEKTHPTLQQVELRQHHLLYPEGFHEQNDCRVFSSTVNWPTQHTAPINTN